MVTEKLSLLSMVLVSAVFSLAAVANAETGVSVESARGCKNDLSYQSESLCSAVIENAHTQLVVDDETCVWDCETHPNAELHIITNYGRFTHSSRLPTTLFLFWSIHDHTVDQFKDAISQIDVNTLVLASPGGKTSASFKLAQILREEEITTYIPAGFSCDSACSHLWYAGASRHHDGELGVHQFDSSYINKPEVLADIESATQTRVAEYLLLYAEFDVPIWAQAKAFRSREMYYFTEDQMAELAAPIGARERDFFDEVNRVAITLFNHETARH